MASLRSVALATSRVAGLAAAERSGQEGLVVLVQGVTGPGNFMYAGGRVVAVVDWELAHLGDPMDDIAWLTLRATQEPFPDLPARVGEYEALSGHAIDEPRVRY
jgi:aminoglycoside phosphotransferase (APT) family kinase protein